MSNQTKNNQHRRSVETLGLSGHGDALILARISQLVQAHTPEQPYQRNTLLRIKDAVDTYLERVEGRGGLI